MLESALGRLSSSLSSERPSSYQSTETELLQARPPSTELLQARPPSTELLQARPLTTSQSQSQRPAPPQRRRSTVRRKWRKKLLYLAACTRLIGQHREPPKGWVDGSKAMLLGSKMNVLLVFGVATPVVRGQAALTFSFACLALLPLAALLGEVTEKVAFHTSETIGGLLNATFGNATEALVSIFALRKGLVRVVQVSLLGSVLSNMLLVLGSAFVAAGLRVKISHFNRTAATANTGLLLVAVLALLVPAMLEAGNEITHASTQALSRSTAVLMLLVYVAYLNFQLSSHSKVFEEEHPDDTTHNGGNQHPGGGGGNLGLADVALVALQQSNAAQRRAAHRAKGSAADDENEQQQGASSLPLPSSSSQRRRNRGLFPEEGGDDDAGDEEQPSASDLNLASSLVAQQRAAGGGAFFDSSPEEEVVLRLEVALGMLAVITVLVAGFSEVLTGSLEGFAEYFELPDAFVGFVLLPLVGNAAEHATAISMAYRSKIDLAIAVALGSSTQIALFVLPLMVILGWIIHQPLALDFGSFETACCALSVLIVAAQAQLGDVHYLNGLCLVVAYVIIAMAFLYIDETPKERGGEEP